MIKKIFSRDKNITFIYYILNIVRLLIPKYVLKSHIKSVLDKVENRDDYDYILDRVNYYNKLDDNFTFVNSSSISVKEFRKNRKKLKSRYFFDTYEYLRFFDDNKRLNFVFGDVTHIPESPSIVKSRPIGGDNKNSVLLNLDKHRHFVFLKDNIKFGEKQNRAIFLSYAHGKPHRIKFLEMYHNREDIITCGDVQKHPEIDPKFYHDSMSIRDHLKYKFILAIEGNDVATNLKWIMSSNSIAVMPKPTYETWFMEGRLTANYHYIEIKADYSDLEEKMNYYIEHPREADEIIKNANNYIAQFKKPKREKIISCLVLQKYLH